MTPKTLMTIALAGTLMGANIANAGHPRSYSDYSTHQVNRFDDTAKVTHVEPVYKTVRINRPERECWDEKRVARYDRRSNRSAGGIVGGILGGVAGHQVGKGRGKAAATIVGTLIGSKIGRDMSGGGQQRVETHVDTETVCRTVNNYREEERLQGYRVSYRYRGQEYTTMMERKPGKRIRVRVKLVVAE